MSNTNTVTIDKYLTKTNILPSRPKRIECGATDNYSQFKDYFGNRCLNEKRAQEIAKDIKKWGNISSISTIREHGRLLVWDGQHVLAACKAAGSHVNYDVYDKVPEHILTMKNKHTKQWTLSQFHQHYLTRDIKVSIDVENFILYTKSLLGRRVELTASLKLLGGAYSNQSYKNGDYKITDYDKAMEIIHYIADIKKYIRFPADSKFVTSYREIVFTGLYDHNIMKNKSHQAYGHIVSDLRVRDIIEQLQNCYNYSLSSKNKVDFLSACGYGQTR